MLRLPLACKYSMQYLPLFIIDAAPLVDSTVPRRARTLCRGRAPRLCAPLVARPVRPARDDSSEPGESCWNAWEATAAAWHHTRRWRGVDAMTMARARTNRREDAPAARLPPALLAKLFRSMS